MEEIGRKCAGQRIGRRQDPRLVGKVRKFKIAQTGPLAATSRHNDDVIIVDHIGFEIVLGEGRRSAPKQQIDAALA